MIWSVVKECDIFSCSVFSKADTSFRSSNPYDYLRMGFYLDNASMYGGKNIVNYKSNLSGDRTSDMLHFSDF